MAVNMLSKAFRQLNIRNPEFFIKCQPVTQVKLPFKPSSDLLSNPGYTNVESLKTNFSITCRSIELNLNIIKPPLPVNKIIECPILPILQIDNPLKNQKEINEINSNKVIEIPNDTNIIEKQAVRMIVIRRKKIKKHKRKKFLKRMKFVIRKREQKRKLKKEKIFQAKLQDIYKQAEEFDAKAYVASRIYLHQRELVPTRYRGELLPEDQVKEFLRLKAERKAENRRRCTYKIKLEND
ncbi:hypothetical protein TKK_0002543 [Trichogramma kaykai]|uniref:Ribosomal protein mS38 C-terminal domain-containing protein n=1 Tax=Trichogramma kaykai TaxID=54128 RepID=A0ABD2WXN5_9HYME